MPLNDRQREILIATGNPGKFREIVQVLASDDCRIAVRWCSLPDLPQTIPAPVEDGATFPENAVLKARHYARASGLWTLADDSGLEVDALGGAPGVISARYAGTSEGTPRHEVDRANNRRLITELRVIPSEQRTARFRCVLALADGEHVLATTEGAVEGKIIDQPRGNNGFGYDPHFLIPSLDRTMAELPPGEKNLISHRGQALRRMREKLLALLPEA